MDAIAKTLSPPLRCRRWRVSSKRNARRGFTLMDAALATTIIGISFVAVMQLLVTGTIANVDSAARTTGLNLARNIRELTIQKPYASLTGYNGANYKPPRDSQGNSLSDFSDWRQVISVQSVDPKHITVTQTSGAPAALRITVTVSRGTEKVCDLSWYSFDATP